MGRKEAAVVWVLLSLMAIAGLSGYARVESASLFAKQSSIDAQKALAAANQQIHKDRTKPVDLIEMARHYLYTQVRVETAAEAVGSGTLIGGDVVLTAAHVVRACEDNDIFVSVFSEDGKVTKLPAHVMAISNEDERDLAVLAVKTDSKLPHVKIMSKEAAARIPVLSPVYAVGFPTGTGPYLTRGDLVNKREPHGMFQDCWFVSSPVIFGNSGGGLFDPATGELIGVPVAIRMFGGMTPVTHMGVVIPGHHIVEWLEEIKVKLD